MKTKRKDFFRNFIQTWPRNTDKIFQKLILVIIFVMAFSIRLFSVVQYESIIHEFDPWFNYRVSKYMAKYGLKKFFTWFDKYSWFPHGRLVSYDTYYGLMLFSFLIHRFLNFIKFPMDIREVCVFMGPFISGFTSITIFLITTEIWDATAGLFAAALVAIIPGYLSRSVAGSYDYECIAIFIMNATFYLWIKSFKTGSLFWSFLCAVAFFCMKVVWGGYIFVPNLIAVHVFVLFLIGKVSRKVYVSYSVYYVFSTIFNTWRTLRPFQYFGNSVHVPALGVFILLQLYITIKYIFAKFPDKKYRKTKFFLSFALVIIVSALFIFKTRKILFHYAGRVLQMFGISHGIDIVKSISEHQRSSWNRFKYDVNIVIYLIPSAIIFLALRPNIERLFLLLYLVFSAYFSYMMVRVILVFAPVACMFAGITLSTSLSSIFSISRKVRAKPIKLFAHLMSLAAIIATYIFFLLFLKHCTEAARYRYSQPSVILSYHNKGERIFVDDFREGFLWLRHNTPRDAKVLSWWDYGYQITGFSKRTVYVDNNTRDTKTIAQVGMILASDEERAYKELIALDVDYVLVVFGGKIGYNSDDINKGYWIIKISSGYYDHVKEIKNFRCDRHGDKRLQNSILFKMCYYRFEEVNDGGYDLLRKMRLGNKISFKYLEEAYTTKNWLVRIYRVKKPEEIVIA